MRLPCFAVAVLPIWLAACQSPPADPVAAKAFAASPSVASDKNPLCHAYIHAGLVRPGDNIPVGMQVRNTDRWCFTAFGWNDDTVEGSSLVDRPAHGEVRLIVHGNSMLYGYRPAPGFAGHDSFLIEVPSGLGEHVNLAVSVRVST